MTDESSSEPKPSNANETSPESIQLSETFLKDLERNAVELGYNVDHLIQTFHQRLHGISNISVQHIHLLKSSVENTSASVDDSISKMNEFMKRMIQLNEDMDAVREIALQVKNMKATVDVLEKTASQLRVLQ